MNTPHATPEDIRADAGTLARNRLLWLVRPLGFLGILLWVLSPGTADTPDLQPQMLLGFLLGAIYGVVFYAEEFRRHLQFQRDLGRTRRNRVPSEYYFGAIEEIRAKWSK